jgi:hypothetical protein
MAINHLSAEKYTGIATGIAYKQGFLVSGYIIRKSSSSQAFLTDICR